MLWAGPRTERGRPAGSAITVERAALPKSTTPLRARQPGQSVGPWSTAAQKDQAPHRAQCVGRRGERALGFAERPEKQTGDTWCHIAVTTPEDLDAG